RERVCRGYCVVARKRADRKVPLVSVATAEAFRLLDLCPAVGRDVESIVHEEDLQRPTATAFIEGDGFDTPGGVSVECLGGPWHKARRELTAIADVGASRIGRRGRGVGRRPGRPGRP